MRVMVTAPQVLSTGGDGSRLSEQVGDTVRVVTAPWIRLRR